LKREKTNYIIQSVNHALDILEEFCKQQDELGVTELSKRLNLHKNNVFRLLATLESRGYIEQNKATENYSLGVKNLELSQAFTKQVGLLRQAKPVLEDLSKKCNETVYIAVARGNSAFYLDAIESKQIVKVASRVGSRLPIFTTSIGKVLIAYEPAEELERMIPKAGLTKYTKHTIVEKKKLIEHLKQVAKQGYAVDYEEYDIGVACTGAPIRDYTRRVVGAISLSGPSSRLTHERIEKEMAPLVVEAAKEISRRLGYVGS
jgi:DNA-binding IclR family transcriptional regulator